MHPLARSFSSPPAAAEAETVDIPGTKLNSRSSRPRRPVDGRERRGRPDRKPDEKRREVTLKPFWIASASDVGRIQTPSARRPPRRTSTA